MLLLSCIRQKLCFKGFNAGKVHRWPCFNLLPGGEKIFNSLVLISEQNEGSIFNLKAEIITPMILSFCHAVIQKWFGMYIIIVFDPSYIKAV